MANQIQEAKTEKLVISNEEDLARKQEWNELLTEEAESIYTDQLRRGVRSAINLVINSEESETPIIDKFNLTLRRCDLERLNWRKNTWLNDNIINFYAEMINQRSRDSPHFPKVFAFNSYLAERLKRDNYEYHQVQRWTRRRYLDMFQCQKVFIPVHLGNH